MKLYYMSTADRRQTAIAVKPKGVNMLEIDKEELERTRVLPFDLELKHPFFKDCELCYDDDFSTIKTIWADCQLNSVLLILCSERLQSIINEHLTGKEGLKWVSCNILLGRERRIYYFPIFTKLLDVLDVDKCFYGGRERTLENLIKPVFDSNKIKEYAIFSCPSNRDYWKLPPSVYVCEGIKRDIVKAGMQKGLCFDLAPISVRSDDE